MTESGSPVPPDDADEAPPAYPGPPADPTAALSRETLRAQPPPPPPPVVGPGSFPPPPPPGSAAAGPGSFPPAPPPGSAAAGPGSFPPAPPPGSPTPGSAGPPGVSPWSQPAPSRPPEYPPATGYPPTGYPPTTGYQSAPLWAATVPTEPVPAPPPARPRFDWKTLAPPLVASAAISVGIILLFLANLLVALGELSGTPGNVRLLQFLSPADVAVASLLIVAVALVVAVPRADEGSGSGFLGAEDVRLMAGFVAVAVAAAALVRAIVVLTIAHEHAVFKLGNMVDALAAVLVAAAAAFWALATK